MTAVVTREGHWYVARCLEVEAVSQGESFEQVMANLAEVVEVYLEEEPMPAPSTGPMSGPIVAGLDVRVPA